MPDHDEDKPVIEYAPIEEGLPFAKAMWRWRSACGWFFWTTLAAALFFPIPALLLGAATMACAVMTIVYLGRMALAEAGAGYAARQIILAVLLSFFVLFGIWLMPPLVQSDLAKWRIVEGRQRVVG